ncbi:hypothetical protein K1719_032359 [Acacia pycnantha]|nr:hypothetical protein K1719_032359 [Acacia pycnantha]
MEVICNCSKFKGFVKLISASDLVSQKELMDWSCKGDQNWYCVTSAGMPDSCPSSSQNNQNICNEYSIPVKAISE